MGDRGANCPPSLREVPAVLQRYGGSETFRPAHCKDLANFPAGVGGAENESDRQNEGRPSGASGETLTDDTRL
jgi:hypothetical protein